LDYQTQNYRADLHKVRCPKPADFKAGFRIQKGTYVAWNGAWDRKGVIVNVRALPKLPQRYSQYTGLPCAQPAVEITVLNLGSYFSTHSRRVVGRFNSKTNQWVASKTQRYEGQRYVAPIKRSLTKTILWVKFTHDGKVFVRPSSGWTPVLTLLQSTNMHVRRR